MKKLPVVFIYADGAASGNPGPGGYGTLLKSGTHFKELSGGYRRTTNNRMELMAVIEGLKALTMHPCEVTIVSDSKYVVDSFLKDWISGWQKRQWKNVKNPDLWKMLIPLVQLHHVQWRWIKGHNGHPENERCDALAVQARMQGNLPVDSFFEQSENDLLFE
jgi:ribonuclease HI